MMDGWMDGWMDRDLPPCLHVKQKTYAESIVSKVSCQHQSTFDQSRENEKRKMTDQSHALGNHRH